MAKKHTRTIKKVISWTIIGLTVVFFIIALKDNWNNLNGLKLSPDALVLAAIVCYVLSIVASGIAWGNVLEKLTGRRFPTSETIQVHLASWLLKYIPGQAGSLLNKLSWGKSRGIDGKLITASFIYENVFLLLASIVLAVPILYISLSEKFLEGGQIFLPLIIFIPAAFLVLMPQAFSFILNRLFKLLRKQKLAENQLLSMKDNLQFLGKFIIPRIINGAAFVFLAESLIDISASQYILFGAIYVLAGIIGLMAIFVPSGLGVREAVIVLFASAYLPIEQAIALSLAARFYATLADITAAAFYFYLTKKKKESL